MKLGRQTVWVVVCDLCCIEQFGNTNSNRAALAQHTVKLSIDHAYNFSMLAPADKEQAIAPTVYMSALQMCQPAGSCAMVNTMVSGDVPRTQKKPRRSRIGAPNSQTRCRLAGEWWCDVGKMQNVLWPVAAAIALVMERQFVTGARRTLHVLAVDGGGSRLPCMLLDTHQNESTNGV